MARPWKIGSVRITAAPIIAASAVSRIGLKRIAPASSRTSVDTACVPNKVDQQDQVAHDDAGERDEADHRGGRERCAEQPMAEHDADEGEQDRRQDDQRKPERTELGHHQYANAEDSHNRLMLSQWLQTIILSLMTALPL
jgi:hypothetical protein